MKRNRVITRQLGSVIMGIRMWELIRVKTGEHVHRVSKNA